MNGADIVQVTNDRGTTAKMELHEKVRVDIGVSTPSPRRGSKDRSRKRAKIRVTFVNSGGAWARGAAAIAHPGRSYDVVFGGKGLSHGQKHRSPPKRIEIATFCSGSTLPGTRAAVAAGKRRVLFEADDRKVFPTSQLVHAQLDPSSVSAIDLRLRSCTTRSPWPTPPRLESWPRAVCLSSRRGRCAAKQNPSAREPWTHPLYMLREHALGRGAR